MFANGTGRVFLQPRRHALRVEDVLALQLHEVLILLELAVADYAHVLVLLLLRSLELLDWELSDLLLRQPLFLLMKVASRKHADQATRSLIIITRSPRPYGFLCLSLCTLLSELSPNRSLP